MVENPIYELKEKKNVNVNDTSAELTISLPGADIQEACEGVEKYFLRIKIIKFICFNDLDSYPYKS